jgi:nicotinamide mononucleotide transporter
MGFYGWWRWLTPDPQGDRPLAIRYSSLQQRLAIAGVTFGLSMAWGAGMSRIHLIFPVFFREPASFPYLDAITTVMSFTAMGLMAKKYLESWYYWIIVDAIGIGLYYAKGVKLIALLYVILFFLAINGLGAWKLKLKKQKI